MKNIFKKENDGYYHLDEILKRKAKYNMIFGERSSGKTYACLEYALRKHCADGSQFAYLRRWEEDFKGKRGASLFDGLVSNGVVKEVTKGKWDSVYYWSGRFYLCKTDPVTKKRITSNDPFGYAFALSTMEHDKSSSYPNIQTVIYDEFLSRNMYIPDEFVVFCNVLSTIIRDRDNVTIFMLGNTVNQYCPYFKEMGLNGIKKMEQGQIDLYTYGDSGLTVAVEFTGGERLRKVKKSDSYFAFSNPKLQMITGGNWELDIYPHCPTKYNQNDIRFSYFIIFDDEVLQADIVKKDNLLFTFIHRKTSPIKDEDRDIVFTPEYDVRRNWRRKIDRPFDTLGKSIWKQYLTFSVYYQDNEVGDVVMNYLNWCLSEK